MTDRPGLYVITLLTMLASCNSCDNTSTLKKEVSNLEKQVRIISEKEKLPILYTSNALGNDVEDVFYVIGEDTAFVEIDGESVKSYFGKDSTQIKVPQKSR